MNQELLKKVKDCKLYGKTDEQIRTELSPVYSADQITDALSSLAYMRPVSYTEGTGQQEVPGAEAPAYQEDDPARPSEILKSYFGGLAVVTVIAVLLGATFNQLATSHLREYFGNFNDVFSYVAYIPVATFIFWFLGRITGMKVLWILPVLSFYVSSSIANSDVAHMLAGYMPINVSLGNLETFVSVVLAYMFLYGLVAPLYKLIKGIGGIPAGKRPNAAQYTLIGIILGWVIVSQAIVLISPPLYIHQKRVRSEVHLPDGEELFSSNVNSYKLYYKKTDNQQKTVYVGSNDLSIDPIRKWWVKDGTSNCGETYGNSATREKQMPFKYGKTKTGVVYGTAKFTFNSSNKPLPTKMYNLQDYCFVLGYQKYVIERTDFTDNSYVADFPIDMVIDSISRSKVFMSATVMSICNKQENIRPEYCKKSDSEALDSLYKTYLHNRTYVKKADEVPGVRSPKLNMNAYEASTWLNITEWGIKVPLPEQLKSVYYAPINYQNGNPYKLSGMKFNLKDVSLSECRDGLGAITRMPLADVKSNDPNTFREGIVLGGFVYQNGTSQSAACSAALAGAGINGDSVADMLFWASANIRQTQ